MNNAADAVLDIGDTTLTLAGTGIYTQNANSKLMVHLSDADYGNIVASGVASVSATSKLEVDVTGLLNGNTFRIIDGAAGSGLNVPEITWDSPLFTITGSVSSNDLWLNVVRGTTYKDAALNSNAAAVGAALDSAPTTGDMAVVKGQLDGLPSRQALTDAMDSMAAPYDGATESVTNNVLTRFVGALLLRMQDSKVEKPAEAKKAKKDVPVAKQEKAAEDASRLNDVWAQVYGDYADQGKRGPSRGYRARLWGTIIGIDRALMDDTMRVGVSENFGFSRINSKDNSGITDINSYQTALYGRYDHKEKPVTVDAILAFGYNRNQSDRKIYAGNIARIAQAEYSSYQLSPYIEAGYKIERKGLQIIPLAALDYTWLHVDGYTEKNADSLNLTVKSQSYDTLRLGAGFRLQKAFENKRGILTPEFHFRYFYAVVNDKQQTLANFAGGGTAFQTVSYRPAPSAFNLGGRLEFFNRENITLLADCDLGFQEGFYEAGGSLTFKYSF